MPLPADLVVISLQLNGSNHRVSMVFSLAHFGFFQIMSAIDQSNMRKSLWIVTQSFYAICADLLRKQPQLAGIAQQTVKERSCLGNAPLHREVIYQPECADGKGSLRSRQSVICMVTVD